MHALVSLSDVCKKLKSLCFFPSVQETVTLKIRLHCEGCIDRIKRRIHKIKGAVPPRSRRGFPARTVRRYLRIPRSNI
jgi:hypothetical protein